MNRSLIWSVLAVVSAAAIGLVTMSPIEIPQAGPNPEQGKARDGVVRSEVVASSPHRPARAGGMGPKGFTEQVQLGYDAGVGWEPAIAVDRYDHVYVLYAQYDGVPGCPDCTSPAAIVQVSADGGETWGSPKIIIPGGSHPNDGQWDPQISVDPIDGRTVYAVWMQNQKDDIAVAKSTDFGETWTVTIADDVNNKPDKPILAVRGQDVYVAYSQINANRMYWSISHNGGETYATYQMQNGPLGLPLAGGGTITSDGTAYFSWGGYKKQGQGTGEITLYVTRSTDGGATWERTVIDSAWPSPECGEPCLWRFLTTQLVMTSDDADNLYLLWDGADYTGDPGRMYFSRSIDGGDTWSPKADVSLAGPDVNHNFPAIAAMGNGEVAISWQDARASGPFSQTYWNTWYRSSRDGGDTWSDEVQVSSFVDGYSYIFPEGYSFPYGDYYELEHDATGAVHLIWGAGESYFGAGQVWYSQGR